MAQTLQSLIDFLREFAPLELAESWDNVGLLLGDPTQPVSRVMTCLTLTPDVAEEAIHKQVDTIVSHHPILFRPVKQLTTATSEGKMILELLARRIAVYSPHTAFDSARSGINQQLAESLGLTEITPLKVAESAELSQANLGTGRCGVLPQPVRAQEFLNVIRNALGVQNLQYVGDLNQRITKVGVACGSAAEFLRDAERMQCDLFLTGEGRFHACLEAQQSGLVMVLAGHFATERPAVESLSTVISTAFPELHCHASEREQDPVRFFQS